MAELKVDPSGLSTAAATCKAASAALAETQAPPATGHATQASAAAVAHGHQLIDAIASRLAAQASLTGYKLHTADGVYRRTDAGSGQAISITMQV
ncbi:hypothetical protein [Mycolicibacterium aubagnense]|uniref:Uncharacterized protein n=1 Tax=Mycolicibacterium aubagnense TaxID=319707 RepID=A0ABM7IAU2_9MYCO|nr:hypothetical protein [Mycolicibacterium aubagnense]WGI34405.1 hypothetical protein QDT91_08730 [Mycolicibacterium aubagnense]BBX83740.1 hypothetical protein MAUB_16130 [Mycolicibacterium aubagnense]